MFKWHDFMYFEAIIQQNMATKSQYYMEKGKSWAKTENYEVEQSEISGHFFGNVNWCSQYDNQDKDSSKNKS